MKSKILLRSILSLPKYYTDVYSIKHVVGNSCIIFVLI